MRPFPAEQENQDFSTVRQDYALFLRAVAVRILTARLSTGARVLDASDCRKWLMELADRIEDGEC
jgi:hypothetical protein